jgi:hypothetical protein
VTHRASDSSQAKGAPLAERKAALIATIEQQRIDILVEAERWHHASATLDSGWDHLKRYRGLLYLAGGTLLVGSARHPGSLARIAKRLLTGGLMLYRARRLLSRLR